MDNNTPTKFQGAIALVQAGAIVVGLIAVAALLALALTA